MNMEVQAELIKCNKQFAEIVKRQQRALEAVSMLKLDDEPSMLGHLRDAVYAFYAPYFQKNNIEQGVLERLLAPKGKG